MDRGLLRDLEEREKIERSRAEERMMKVKKQRHDLRSTQGQIHQSSLRIILLGSKNYGKSSTGNTILGEDVFELRTISKCEKREGEVAGRQVTVVDTPGWELHSMDNPPVFLKQETLMSVSLCDPGPHVFLLIVALDTAVTSQVRLQLQKYLTLFSKAIWSHTMVLFDFGDWLGDTLIEQHIESEGRDLCWLIEQCGNRYHVFNNEKKDDKDQVTELLAKIEEMLAGNSGHHYETDRKRLEEVKERRAKEEQRATERLMKVEKQRKHLQSLKQNTCPLSEFRVVLLGYRTSGKSSSGNTILGREEFDLKRRTAQCVKRQGEVTCRQVTVVEAPGWWINFNLKTCLELTKQEIVFSVSLCPPGPHIFLLIVKIAEASTQDYIRNIQEHVEILSERVWCHTMVLFTRGDWLGNATIEQYIESEEHLRYLVEKCGNRYHVLNNEDIGDRTQITELMEKMEEIISGNGGRHYEMDRKRLEEVKERRENEEERATERLMKVERQRQHLQSLKPGHASPQSEFRVVLLGYRTSGKSSSGNTILGREEFDLKRRTAQCVKRQGEVAGRQVTVVKAPGWWKNVNLINTPELTKQEIVLSVSLCPPGPHIILLLVQVAHSIEQDDIRNIQEHVEILSDRVWCHTMVLFTRGDWLGDTTIEQYIESEEHLRYLVEKCGNRYHVLNNEDIGDRTQITELMEKMEEIISGNGGRHYEMDRKRLEEVKERRRNEEQRATERLMKVERQRQHLQSLKPGHASPQSEFRVVLLGYRMSGKSSSGNTILGREEFDLKRRTAQCVKRQGEVAGRQVTVVKAPGWWKNVNLINTPELTKQEIVLSVSLCPPGPHIILLLVQVAHSIEQDDIRNIQEHVEILSDRVWCHTMVLFTRGDWLGDTTIEQYIESEEHLRYLVEKCGNRYHVLNNEDIGDRTQITELMEKMEEIISGNGGRHYEMDRKRLEEVKERRRNEEQRATERLMKVERQRQHLQSLKPGHASPQSEFRVVLLGYRTSGKSSSGNTILGREEFDLKRRTAQCVKRQGKVAGRQVTVVKAPGWWKNVNLINTPELTKQEIVLSVSLCPPGPHILLLLVQLAQSIAQDDIRNIQQHMEYLSERVWCHTMVLFTRGDWLGDTTIEQYIESEEHLRYLVEKCGNRYHVLNNEDKSDRTQITELMEMMEEIISGNGGRHYEMDRKRLEEVKERREKEERATERLMKVEKQRQHLQSLKQFRVVLLGYRTSGKSSSGNTILGREEFDLKRRTAQCVKRQGEVAGRQVTVVKAPGWWKNVNLINTPELTKQEIVLSVSLCPPGPHILLLLVQLAHSIAQDDIRNIQEHVEILSDRVWCHTMVLFTRGDWLGDTTIEQYIESEEHLRYLVEKCGNRYHVLNNENKSDRTQITGLMEMMEEIAVGNGGRHYEMDRKRLEEVKERREKEEQRATERLMKVEKQRQHLQSLKRNSSPRSEFRVVLLGYRRSGKSSSGNTILGREEFDLKRRTAQCVKRQGEVAGRQVTVVKAPGWWSNINLINTPDLTKQEIVLSVSLCPPGPHILLLLVKVATSLTVDKKLNIQQHLELLSNRVWSHTMVLFTCGDCLGDTTIEQYIESEEHLRYLVEKCGNRYHVLNNQNRDDKQVTQLLEKIEEMVAGNGGRHFEVDKTLLQEVKKKRRHLSTRVEDRETRAYKQEVMFKYVMGELQPLCGIKVMLLQYVEEFTSERNTDRDRGEMAEGVTLQSAEEIRGGHEIARVKMTPSKRSLEETKAELVSLCDPGPHALVLSIYTDLHFTERRRRQFQTHLGLLGDRVWDHAIVMFDSSDDLSVDRNIEEYIESEGEALQWLVEKCGNRYVHWTGEESRPGVLKKVYELVVLNGGSHFQYEEGRTNETTAADWKMEVQQLVEQMEEIELAKSKDTAPDMTGDDKSEKTSGYGTFISDTASEAPSDQHSLMSGGTSSGIGSLTSGRLGCHKKFDKVPEPSNVHGPNVIREDSSEDTFLDQNDLDSVDNPDWRRDMRELSDNMAELDISSGKILCQYFKQTNCCKSCKDVEDTSHWILMEPCVSMETGVPVYKHSSPPGSFECTASGLRWVCAVEVSLQYHFSDPNVFRAELAMLQYEPIGPLMDIKVLSGELLEAHLPHFACLEGSDSSLREAVRVLRGVDSSVTLEKCELTRFHAKLLKPSFSLTEVLVKFGIPMKAHLDVLIYRTRVTPLVLLTYVVPRDASMIQAVEEDLRETQDAKKIKTHRPDMSIWMHTKFSLKSSASHARSSPPEITLKYIRPPDLFRVVVDKADDCFDLELISEGQSIWKATLESFEFGETGDVAHSHEMPSAASRRCQVMTHREVAYTSRAARTDEEEGKMASMLHKDRLFMIRPDLIKKTSGALLRDLLDELQASPHVISSREAEDVLQRTSVLQDQVTSLIDMVLKKGDRACGIMLSLLKELDSYLYQDLGL
ncbi:uncharacterized protein LOC125297516 isoform X3 [Alosa alosa]|uniref:uncharacterized protein LOC125297516 isoform X3 n=1 Tax=Alosa alosa TaxID=278164 RepID=UPI0020152B99|nr:uncharacterized protein LOC125297516 isoform X3 [Alosa alosa]